MKQDTVSARTTRQSVGLNSLLTLLLAMAILLMINYLGFKYYAHKDLSQSQFYTLSPKTIDVLKKLDAPITIYTILSDKYRSQIDELLKEYEQAGGKNIIVQKVDPDMNPAMASNLQKKLNFAPTDFLIIFQYKDHPPRFVKEEDVADVNPMTQTMSSFKGEQQFTSAIVAEVEGKASKVYFTIGHGEHDIASLDSPQGYGGVGRVLKRENIDAENLDLATLADVPPDADAVVIAGPQATFSAQEAGEVDRYLSKNGKLFILLDPYVSLGLDDLLKKYGIKFDNDVVLFRAMTQTGSQMTLPLALIQDDGFANHPVTLKFPANGLHLQISGGARSLTLLNNASGQPMTGAGFLLKTDASSWGWIGSASAATSELEIKDRVFNATTDIKGPLNIAAYYDGGDTTDPATTLTVNPTRVVALGASRFLENDTADTVGADFFTNVLDWEVKKNASLDISAKTPQEYGLTVSPMSLRTIAVFALILLPLGALFLGVIMWFSRRK